MSDEFKIKPKEFSGCRVLLQLGEGGRIVSGFFRVSLGSGVLPDDEDCEASLRAVVPSLDLGRTLPGEVELHLSSDDIRSLKKREASDHAKTGREFEYLWVIDPARTQ